MLSTLELDEQLVSLFKWVRCDTCGAHTEIISPLVDDGDFIFCLADNSEPSLTTFAHAAERQ